MEVAAGISFVTFLLLWPNGGRFSITKKWVLTLDENLSYS